MIRVVAIVLRVVLGAVFLYAAWTKLSQPWALFAMSIDAYGLLPEWGVLFVARTLPWAELSIGLLLLTGWWLRWTSLIAATLLGVFFVIMLVSWSKGMGIDCGCFGVGEALTWKTLVRDGGLLSTAIGLCVMAFASSRLLRRVT
ncbi:MAG: MauE/DoxX family redox-associated membrane protein [Bryobacteraceae bacterium]|nr:MauE/DoxX family redox-associated membrane protein [Bryobacteraceae bacterium]